MHGIQLQHRLAVPNAWHAIATRVCKKANRTSCESYVSLMHAWWRHTATWCETREWGDKDCPPSLHRLHRVEALSPMSRAALEEVCRNGAFARISFRVDTFQIPPPFSLPSSAASFSSWVQGRRPPHPLRFQLPSRHKKTTAPEKWSVQNHSKLGDYPLTSSPMPASQKEVLHKHVSSPLRMGGVKTRKLGNPSQL